MTTRTEALKVWLRSKNILLTDDEVSMIEYFYKDNAASSTATPSRVFQIYHDERKFSHTRYAELMAKTIEKMKMLAEYKGGEYAGDSDRLANFRRNAEKNLVPYEVIWNVYCSKHWDALQQYIQDVQSGKKRVRLESLADRCDDIIVYLTLFKAILAEAEDMETTDAHK